MSEWKKQAQLKLKWNDNFLEFCIRNTYTKSVESAAV